ncbi:MAG: radical SAM protein [Nitrospirota bacterium]
MRVTEIFHSIQGESTFAGLPCVFVRVTGCPLRCTWCDTAYAFYDGDEMNLDQVMARVAGFGCRLVEITGGEPLHNPEAFALIARLADAGYTVLVETSGAIDIAPVDRRAVIIMDLKCPGSGMDDRNLWGNLDRLKPGDQVKFVLKDREDYEWTREVLARTRVHERQTVLFSTVFGELDPKVLAEWMLEDRVSARLQLQLHKLIWDPAARGV